MIKLRAIQGKFYYLLRLVQLCILVTTLDSRLLLKSHRGSAVSYQVMHSAALVRERRERRRARMSSHFAFLIQKAILKSSRIFFKNQISE
jgi:hypothetical protein